MMRGKKVSTSEVQAAEKPVIASKVSKRTGAKRAANAAAQEHGAVKLPTKPVAAKSARTPIDKARATKVASSRAAPRSRGKLPTAANDVASPPKPPAGSAFDQDVAKLAAAPPHSPVRIFQIYFVAWHRDLLDPDFAPYDNSGAKSELLEFDVFERLAKSELTEGAELWGALS